MTKVDEELSKIITTSVENQEQATRLLDRLFENVNAHTVFGEPVNVGEYTVITASEATVSLGFGYGVGGGSGPAVAPGEHVSKNGTSGAEAAGGGGGGAGGGMSTSRPVSVITIGPDGVKVSPIVDPTKFMLAFFKAFFRFANSIVRTQSLFKMAIAKRKIGPAAS